jgi:hypothetical protein
MHGQQMAWDQLLALTTTAGNVAVKNGEKITMALKNMSMILLTKALLKVDPLLALQTTSHPLLGQRMELGRPVEMTRKPHKTKPASAGFLMRKIN